MNHDKDLDKLLNNTLLRFFDGQLSLSQTREAIKRLTGRSFLEIGGEPKTYVTEPSDLPKGLIEHHRVYSVNAKKGKK